MRSAPSTIDLGHVYVLDLLGDVGIDMLRTVLSFDAALRGRRANHGAEDPPRVLVRIASRGGETDTAAAIHEALTLMPAEIVTLGFGSVSSAAVIVFCAGKMRLLTAGTRVVYHAPRWNPEGSYTVEEQQRVLTVSERRFELAAQILSGTTGTSVQQMERDLAAGLVFSAEEAVAARIATTAVECLRFEPQALGA